jgi:hypothetical protein
MAAGAAAYELDMYSSALTGMAVPGRSQHFELLCDSLTVPLLLLLTTAGHSVKVTPSIMARPSMRCLCALPILLLLAAAAFEGASAAGEYAYCSAYLYAVLGFWRGTHQQQQQQQRTASCAACLMQ